ncbi:MAG TPA: FHA domain-containing serine/threonine-protein kinase [Polyangiaceae bacterium]|nr:FHA domain-containing serine/threonine-protein kinase [Polyangiaceae bacterium]
MPLDPGSDEAPLAAHALLVENGPSASQSVRLEAGREVIVGRAADAGLQLVDDPEASRRHTSFELVRGGVRVRDLDSRNGTWIGGERVDDVVVEAGTRVRVGRTVLLVQGAESLRDTVIAPPAALATEEPTRPEQEASNRKAARLDDSIFGLAGEGDVDPFASPWSCDGCGAPGPAPKTDAGEVRFEGAGWLCESCARARDARDRDDPESVGSYQVLRAIGRGAMAVVYEARHRRTGAHVAVKVLLPAATLDRVLVRRFLKEQRLALSLVHPRVVRCFDVGQDDENHHLYLVVEWLPGGDAARAGKAGLEVDAALWLGADLFEALGYLHGRGLVHRDVKPANLLLAPTRTGRTHGKLGDFGILKGLHDLGSGLTGDADVGGTPLFLAPEQLLDFKWVGRSADIYGAAASLYYLLTGETPLNLASDSVPNVVALTAVLADERIRVRERRPDLSPELASWLDRAVSRDPTERESMDAAQLAHWLRTLAE